MSTLVKILALTGVVEFIVGATAHMIMRRQLGGRIPTWVHVTAGTSILVAIALVWDSQAVGGTPLWRDLLAIPILPVMTYLSYGFYGAWYRPRGPSSGRPDA